MNINIARYSKLISPKNTRHNEEKEEKLLKRCPPGHEGTRFVDIPATILDVSGTIIAWYLPDALTAETQNLADPEVSASLKGPLSKGILNAIARPAAIASAALRIMHPEQYWAGLQTFSSLGEKAESKELPRMSEILEYWASYEPSLLMTLPKSIADAYNDCPEPSVSLDEIQGPKAIADAYNNCPEPSVSLDDTQGPISIADAYNNCPEPSMSLDDTRGNAKKNGLLQKEPYKSKGHREAKKIHQGQELGNWLNAGSRESVMEIRNSKFNIWQSTFGTRRSDLGTRYSTLGPRNSVINTRTSELDIRSSVIGSQHSGVDTRTSVVMFRESGIGNGESGTRISIFGSKHSALDTWYLTFWNSVTFGSRESVMENPELGVRYSELRTRYSVFGNRASALGSRCSDLEFDIWSSEPDIQSSEPDIQSSVIGSRHSGVDTWTSVVTFRESGIGNGDLELGV
ncbi:uncharacterized protein EDB93DRAFT_1109540 [Suillus bovinus]|uniref:uncharacterized protein n=1 Tax=Suillus bovinus TaxID=48563 RepID=UPI001B85D58C|nr:uncharacterized protein EDB93DRAFT_1109540 [Suillus bovinus]KAG2126880.1 hypothetical protein EDB93DRAFT_1109540 [Suillus bovinus]